MLYVNSKLLLNHFLYSNVVGDCAPIIVDYLQIVSVAYDVSLIKGECSVSLEVSNVV